MFKESCFRHFLDFYVDVVFSSQLVHSLLVKEIVVDGINHHELWFGIGNCKAKFSKQKFCLVIGLKFGPLSNIFNDNYVPITDGIHKKNTLMVRIYKVLHYTKGLVKEILRKNLFG